VHNALDFTYILYFAVGVCIINKDNVFHSFSDREITCPPFLCRFDLLPFSSGTPVSSTIKTGRHDIAEILLKVALNSKNHNHNQRFELSSCLCWFYMIVRPEWFIICIINLRLSNNYTAGQHWLLNKWKEGYPF
jgi:hypothetical protein